MPSHQEFVHQTGNQLPNQYSNRELPDYNYQNTNFAPSLIGGGGHESSEQESFQFGSRQGASQPITTRAVPGQGYVDPTSQGYLDWYRGVNNMLSSNNQSGNK